jgi:succinate-semialdehyde dehydrogenase/glutarate-semialdehyde dehydrogenase
LRLAERAQVLLDLHDLVLDRRHEAMDLIQWENGKARKHAFEEVAHVAMTARYYGLTAKRHLESQRRSGLFPLLTSVHVNHVPKGVVGIISPWNYPFTMGVSDGLPALLAGNAVVHKPTARRCSPPCSAPGCCARRACRTTCGSRLRAPGRSSAAH